MALYLFVEVMLVHQSHEVRTVKRKVILVFKYYSIKGYVERKVKIKYIRNLHTSWR
jgi:hypothetical protein